MADQIPQTQTLPDNFQSVEGWLDGMSNAEAGLLVLGLTLLVSFVVWLFRRNAKKQEMPSMSEDNPHPNPSPESGEGLEKRIQIDRLPTVAGEFFGREAELRLLDEALDNALFHHPNPSPRGRGAKDGTDVPPRPIRERGLGGEGSRILQFIASGGTGKTKLLRHWLNQRQDAIGNYIIWSFYSQGTSESKQVSATPLITETFKQFGLVYEDYATDEDRADALAQQLAQHKCLLVLDGLEPLQHGGRGFDGQLKDRAMKRLLQQLAQQSDCLCIITTRIHVHDLKDRAYVVSYPLDNLKTADGMQLLRSLAVQGADKELQTAVEEVEGHALTLHLLGNALTTYLDGDIRKRDTLEELVDDFDEQGRHAFKVMQGYEHWLTNDDGQSTAELQSLYLLGLFDHPIETAVLQVLWDKQIPNLTAGISRKAWLVALRDLQNKHRLLSQHGERSDLLDCHPLIREYFGRQLQQQQPDAWQQAHEALYHYYKALPDKEQPDTLEEMQPLFHAVAHGCAAGLHQQALHEVYWPRIQRSGENYLCNKHGAFSDDLAVVAHFFSLPWRIPAAGLGEAEQAGVLNWAGFRLRALGRLREALQPMEVGMERSTKEEDWKGAAVDASNLSELQLTLGQVAAAVDSGKRSVGYADQSGDMFRKLYERTTHAYALHQSGQVEAALAGFAAAEQLQRERRQSAYPRLSSLQGFRYCDLLLAQGKTVEVIERAEQTLGWATNAGKDILSAALDQLSLGRAHHAQGDLLQVCDWLHQAVSGLRKAGDQSMLPLGLLARAALWRDMKEWDKAHRDLAEVWDIAEPSGMRLHLTDYHLERARLLLAEGETHPPPSLIREGAEAHVVAGSAASSSPDKGRLGGVSLREGDVRQHVEAAANLIAETGYHRRDKELRDLQLKLALHGLYAITDGSTGDTLIAKAEAALRGGARILQYRDKTTDTARRQQEAQQLLTLCEQYGAVFVVNDDVELAQLVGAHGVHVGKDDADLSAARAALGDDAIIGVSCYNRLELAQTAQDNGADYVAFGSMFVSPTKPNAPRASLALLQEAQQTLHVPICTIGGITLDNAPQLIHNGAAMIAVISELFAAEQTAIQRNAQQFSQLF